MSQSLHINDRFRCPIHSDDGQHAEDDDPDSGAWH